MSVPIRSVKVWVNAFIPQDIPGYTRVVPRGTYAGKTMIPGPQRPGFGTSRIEISDCYLTDQRGFSNEIHAKSRLHSEIRVDYNGPRPVLSDWHNCDPTTECDCEDGAVEATKKGDASRCRCTLLIPFGQAAAAAGKVSVKMKSAASNPCAPTSYIFGDIDFEGYVHIDPPARRIEIDLQIDAFPAFEAYATINDGAGVAMFQEMPPAGNTVMNLPLGAMRRIRRRLEDRNGDGTFDTLTRL